MSVVPSADLVVSDTANGGGATITKENPIVAWNSVVTISNIAATSADPDFPVTNLANGSTNSKWLATSTAIQFLTLTYTGTIDHVAIARHNFFAAGSTVSLELDVGAGFVQKIAPAIPPDDGPLIYRFNPTAIVGARLKLAAGSVPVFASVMYSGVLLTLQRRIYVGHTPMSMGRVVDVVNGRSESGEYLGRIVLREYRQTSVALQNLTPAWYRTFMDPFVQAACRDTPFFFAWRPLTYPLETGYGAFSGTAAPRNQKNNGMMQIDFQMSGIGNNSA